MTDIENIPPRTVNPTPDRFSQLSKKLLWLNERAWPLTLVILLTAGVYLYQYIQEEKIPLSITSSAVITALPVMSAILMFVISILLAFVLLPIFVLFHRLNDSGKRLSDELGLEQTTPENRARHSRMLGRWGGSLLILGTFCAVLCVIGSQVTGNWYWGTAAVVGTGLTIACYYWLMTRGVEGPVSMDFRIACVMSAFVQVCVILNVTIVAIDIAGQYVSNLWWLVPLMLVELLVVWIIQLLGALFVLKMRSHENPVALVASAVMVLVLVLGLYPPTGAKLGGFAFQVSASGARNCTLMNFAPESKGLEALTDPDRPGFSRPLRVIAEADGTYFVRPWKTDSKAVQFVPRASLVGVDVCPAAKPKAASSGAPAPIPG
ncbi:hypothetical protein J2W17_002053 [Pseudomonas lini]|uniref:hypothetical protein n=1 Tax=Pseudomonas lini TaxID=163011 RepID=UPI00277EE2AF|nr:hypothetical protein [Pseudomonas lini]MDQ0123106.1 hypothetical protein [Pseudomonas lini]